TLPNPPAVYASPACMHIHLTTTQHNPKSRLFPYTTLFRSAAKKTCAAPWPAAWDSLAARQTAGTHAACPGRRRAHRVAPRGCVRSEEHTSELQSRENLVCRLLLVKKH